MQNPEVYKKVQIVKEEISKMSAEEKDAFREKMGKRMEVMGKLEPEARAAYAAKLPEEEQMNNLKFQVLHLQDQVEAQEKAQQSGSTGRDLNNAMQVAQRMA